MPIRQVTVASTEGALAFILQAPTVLALRRRGTP